MVSGRAVGEGTCVAVAVGSSVADGSGVELGSDVGTAVSLGAVVWAGSVAAVVAVGVWAAGLQPPRTAMSMINVTRAIFFIEFSINQIKRGMRRGSNPPYDPHMMPVYNCAWNKAVCKVLGIISR